MFLTARLKWLWKNNEFTKPIWFAFYRLKINISNNCMRLMRYLNFNCSAVSFGAVVFYEFVPSSQTRCALGLTDNYSTPSSWSPAKKMPPTTTPVVTTPLVKLLLYIWYELADFVMNNCLLFESKSSLKFWNWFRLAEPCVTYICQQIFMKTTLE